MKFNPFYGLLVGVILGSFVLGGCALQTPDRTASTAPVTLFEERAHPEKDMPIIRMYVTIIFRDVPQRGAIGNFMDHLGNSLEGITPAGVAATVGTTQERLFAKLEQGTRAQISIPIEIDNPDGEEIDFTFELTKSDVKSAVENAADSANLSTVSFGGASGTVINGDFKFRIKTNEVSDTN